MDSSASVLDSLRTVEFRLGLKGYNVDEVDEYLEKAAVEATSLKEQLRQTTERLKQASERIAELEAQRGAAPVDRGESDGPSVAAASVIPAPLVAPAPPEPVLPPPPVPVPQPVVQSDDALSQTLLMAQRFVEQAKRESESEAMAIVSRAEDQANAIVNQAEEQARRLAMDSEQRLREEVHRLESARSQLASDVESLGRYLDAERNRLRGSLDEIGKWLDEKLQPGATVAALRARPSASAEITAGANRLGPRPAAGDPRASIGDGTNGGGMPSGGDYHSHSLPGEGGSHSL